MQTSILGALPAVLSLVVVACHHNDSIGSGRTTDAGSGTGGSPLAGSSGTGGTALVDPAGGGSSAGGAALVGPLGGGSSAGGTAPVGPLGGGSSKGGAASSADGAAPIGSSGDRAAGGTNGQSTGKGDVDSPAPTCDSGMTYYEPGCEPRNGEIRAGCYQPCDPRRTDAGLCPSGSLCQLTTTNPCICRAGEMCCEACGTDSWLCLPPPSDCRNAERQTMILSAKNTFGECMGECTFLLEISASTDQPPACDVVRFTGRGWQVTDPIRLNTGVLTPAGHERVRTLAFALENVELQARYGCPDCADGGASQLTIIRQNQTVTPVYEYRDPPRELVEADALVQSILDALEKCQANPYVVLGPNCTTH